jgi:membrane protein implicated in regulation of membrane protease activity
MLQPDLLSLLLADNAAVLTAVYWVCLIAGGGLLLVSVFSGGSEGGVDVDAHAGLDFHAEADAGVMPADIGHTDIGHADTGHAADLHPTAGLSTWFSFRFMVFFIAVFGAVGVVLTYLTRAPTGTTFAIALVGGALVGQVVHQLFRAIRRTSGDSTPQPQDYVHKLARVTIAVEPPQMGEVALSVRNAERFAPAMAADHSTKFNIGDEVVVVAYRGGIAEVVSRKQYEQSRSA